MSKKKRTFNADVIISSSLRLSRTAASHEKRPDHAGIRVPKKQYFSPELIARLAERIKKL